MDSMNDRPESIDSAEAAGAASPANDAGLAQADIEKLLAAAGAKPPGPTAVAPRPDLSEPAIGRGDVDYLLSQAEQALASINSPVEPSNTPPVQPFKLQDFTGSPPNSDAATLDLIREVELDLKIELGRTEMYLEDVLKLRKGSVVPLDKLAGDPVDVYVNGRLVARGEVLVLNDNFCVRVAELIAAENVA
jgi:flagellar motor switch protein FliN/FliY